MSRNKPIRHVVKITPQQQYAHCSVQVRRRCVQLLISGFSILFVSCGAGESNVNAPKGGAIGSRY
jgi:hypothetical protein